MMSMCGLMMLGAMTMARLLESIRLSVASSATPWSNFINTHKHWRERRERGRGKKEGEERRRERKEGEREMVI